jgi:site-specific DNA recombinase
MVGREEVAGALSQFEPLWDTLAPREKERILRLLLERVVYDGAARTVSLTFRPSGLRALDEMADEVGAQTGGKANG